MGETTGLEDQSDEMGGTRRNFSQIPSHIYNPRLLKVADLLNGTDDMSVVLWTTCYCGTEVVWRAAGEPGGTDAVWSYVSRNNLYDM